MLYYILFIIIVIIVSGLWRSQFIYWRRKNVNGPMPWPLIGNFGRMVTMQQSFGELVESLYSQYPDEKYVGFHCGSTPILLLRDPDVIKRVLISDFNIFVNRGLKTSEGGFNHNLFEAEGDVWRTIRKKLTPNFTMTKLKQLTPEINLCVNRLTECIEEAIEHDHSVNIMNFANEFSLDVISSSLFGLRLKFYKNDDSNTTYLKMITKASVKPSIFFWLWYFTELVVPGLHKLFYSKLDLINNIRNFFIKLMNVSMDFRESYGVKRNDVLDTLVKFKKEGKIVLHNEIPTAELEIDNNLITGILFNMYSAGFDTLATSFSLLLHELSLRPEIQDKIYEEIRFTMNKYNGELNYDSIKEMNYLQSALNETTRKHTLLEWVLRKSIAEYTFPGTQICIPSGSLVVVSISGIHNDPKYYNDPNKFEPSNCSTDSLREKHPCSFLPFGIGPRNCIGLSFAKLTVMLAVATFLTKFEVKPTLPLELHQPFKYDFANVARIPSNGVSITVSRRN